MTDQTDQASATPTEPSPDDQTAEALEAPASETQPETPPEPSPEAAPAEAPAPEPEPEPAAEPQPEPKPEPEREAAPSPRSPLLAHLEHDVLDDEGRIIARAVQPLAPEPAPEPGPSFYGSDPVPVGEVHLAVADVHAALHDVKQANPAVDVGHVHHALDRLRHLLGLA